MVGTARKKAEDGTRGMATMRSRYAPRDGKKMSLSEGLSAKTSPYGELNWYFGSSW